MFISKINFCVENMFDQMYSFKRIDQLLLFSSCLIFIFIFCFFQCLSLKFILCYQIEGYINNMIKLNLVL